MARPKKRNCLFPVTSQGAKPQFFKFRGTREGKSNGPFQHLVHPSSIKKHLSAGLKK